MSGCEHLRLNDLSSSDSRTLFYIVPVEEQETIELHIASVEPDKKLKIENNPQTVAHIEILAPVTPEVYELDSEPVQQEVTGDVASTPLDVSSDISFFERLFSSSDNADQSSEHTRDDELVADSGDEILVDDISNNNEAISDAAIIVDINRLNKSTPTAAGQPSKLVNVDTLDSKKNVTAKLKEKSSFPAIGQDLKKALASAQLEILHWQLEMQKASNDGISCRLSSPTLQIESQHYTTQLWLNIENDRLFVNATMDINPQLPYVGIHFDDGHYEPFQSNHHPQYAIWEGDLKELIHSNNKMNLILGGNDLKSQIQLAAIDLNTLRQIYPKYVACSKRLVLNNQ